MIETLLLFNAILSAPPEKASGIAAGSCPIALRRIRASVDSGMDKSPRVPRVLKTPSQTLGEDIVAVLFTNPLAFSDRTAPETAMAGALEVGVTPATAMRSDGRAVKVWLRVVKTEDDGVGGDGKVGRTRGIVDVPARKPLGP